MLIQGNTRTQRTV